MCNNLIRMQIREIEMGKRGRPRKELRIEIGKNENELRYTSVMAALAAAMPDIADAIISGENSKCDANPPKQAPDPTPTDHEQHDLKN